MSAAPHPPGRSPPDWYPCIPPPRPVSLPPGPRASRSVVLAAARLRALHLDPLRRPTAEGSYAGHHEPSTLAPSSLRGFLTRIRRPRTGKRGISSGQRRESAERRVPLGGSLFRRAALEVPDDSLQAWPAASISAFNGHGFLVRKPQYVAAKIL